MATLEPPIHHHTGYFPSHDQTSLYYQHWWSDQPTQAVVVIVHGLGAHSDLFQNVVAALVPAGYHLYALDLRGHGRSSGRRGYINQWGEFRGDVGALLALVTQEQPTVPYFLMGHSVGGAIVLDYTLRHPELLQGAIVSNPALGAISISPVKLTIARLLSQIWPTFSLNTGVDNAAGARDPAIVESYNQDPLRHTIGSARLATEFLDTAAWIDEHATDLQVPLLLLQSEADSVTLPQGSERLFDRITIADKTRKTYPESYHEIYDDQDYPTVLQDVRQWLEQHIPQSI
ncbi:alpha/beta hydrolase [filamentous cyanobacterium LEGE 11480]|uniref:Monoacylglycerol lipase n=1 Tax=Romeriopsis navalis LEGE 11480 TaxID=2777977 RepID=A0A928Z3D6_9CYAN|nr:alpha/beta hydrolase [Romeriopsis navalis]MBE9031411.1 alpha/beta hydrolase [Romeriopsis navalis LEGE 11480]